MNSLFALAHHGVNSLARWLKTELLTVLYTIPGSLPLVIWLIASGTRLDTASTSTAGISQVVLFILLTLPYATALWGLARQVRKQHGRHWLTLITPKQHIDWRKFFYAGAVWFGIGLLVEVVSFAITPTRYTFSFQPSVFLPLVLAVLVMIPIQASFEEIAFRGYLMQQTALISKRVWQPLVSTSLFFALLHIANPEVKAYGLLLTMPSYFMMGLMLGVATLMDDGLEIAMGAHTANNIFAFLIVSEPNSVMKTPTLFTVPAVPPTIWSIFLLAICGAFFLIIMARKYRWDNFSKLLAPLDWRVLEEAQNMEQSASSSVAAVEARPEAADERPVTVSSAL
jgi:membrane protease YdiL (CAAX protease family)